MQDKDIYSEDVWVAFFAHAKKLSETVIARRADNENDVVRDCGVPNTRLTSDFYALGNAECQPEFNNADNAGISSRGGEV